MTRITRNVIGYYEGTEEPDRYIIFGNHRDAWVFGAMDPNSGTTIMIEGTLEFRSSSNNKINIIFIISDQGVWCPLRNWMASTKISHVCLLGVRRIRPYRKSRMG